MELIDLEGSAPDGLVELHAITPAEVLLAAELEFDDVKITGGSITLEFPAHNTTVHYDFAAGVKTVRKTVRG